LLDLITYFILKEHSNHSIQTKTAFRSGSKNLNNIQKDSKLTAPFIFSFIFFSIHHRQF